MSNKQWLLYIHCYIWDDHSTFTPKPFWVKYTVDGTVVYDDAWAVQIVLTIWQAMCLRDVFVGCILRLRSYDIAGVGGRCTRCKIGVYALMPSLLGGEITVSKFRLKTTKRLTDKLHKLIWPPSEMRKRTDNLPSLTINIPWHVPNSYCNSIKQVA